VLQGWSGISQIKMLYLVSMCDMYHDVLAMGERGVDLAQWRFLAGDSRPHLTPKPALAFCL
jgi:hypothetical protein